MSQILIAPDSFKGSATAVEVARSLAEGWTQVRPDDSITLAPMADGGEGTLDAFELARPGSRRMPVLVTGPDDRPVEAHWLLLPDGTGLVELAATSGITLLDPLRPLTAHTRGFGQAIAAALDHGVHRLLLAIGGSSSTDGGVGALRELGADFLDAAGDPIPDGGIGLADLAEVRLAGLRPPPPEGVVVLSDVTNPLLGDTGAAHVFGPQKGADVVDVATLDAGLSKLSSFRLLAGADDVPGHRLPGTGAAGGVGYGLLVWGARMAAGSRAVGEELGIPAHLERADLVVTGEGRFDSQSLSGKVPWYILTAAQDVGVPTALVAGATVASTEQFLHARSLSVMAGSPAVAIAGPLPFLRTAGEELARAFNARSAVRQD